MSSHSDRARFLGKSRSHAAVREIERNKARVKADLRRTAAEIRAASERPSAVSDIAGWTGLIGTVLGCVGIVIYHTIGG